MLIFLRCRQMRPQAVTLWYAIDGRSSEPHSHPCKEQLQHEFSGVAWIVGHIVRQNHTLGSFGSHHPHGCRWDIVWEAAAIDREPVTLGEVEEHGRVTTARVHSPRRRIRFQSSLLKNVPALDAAYSILATAKKESTPGAA
jgi:hypothetical protein